MSRIVTGCETVPRTKKETGKMKTEQTENAIMGHVQNILHSIIGTLKKTFTVKGRATRKEFWTFVVFAVIVLILAALPSIALPYVFTPIFSLILLWFTIAYISVLVRRFHDIGLTGFWIWYLNPFGLPVIYVVYLLGLDSTCEKVIGKIKTVGSPWLGWILTYLMWPAGASAAMCLLTLYKGEEKDNEFGPNPYAE